MTYSEWIKKKREEEGRTVTSSSNQPAKKEDKGETQVTASPSSGTKKSYTEWIKEKKGVGGTHDNRQGVYKPKVTNTGTTTKRTYATVKSEMDNLKSRRLSLLEEANKRMNYRRANDDDNSLQSIGSELASINTKLRNLKTELKGLEHTRPVYSNETASQKMDAVTNAEKALTQVRGSGTDIGTEITRLGENLTNLESGVQKMVEAYQNDPTEENYNKYLAVYDEYMRAAEDYNVRYGEYKGLVDSYNAAHEDYTEYMGSAKSDASGWEIVGNAAAAGLGAAGKMVGSTLDFLLPAELWDEKDPLSKFIKSQAEEAQYYNDRWQESIYGRSGFAKTGSEVVEATVAAVPNAILALMSGGSSLAAQGTATSAAALAAYNGGMGIAAGTGLASTLGTVASNMVRDPLYWSSVVQMLGPSYEEAKARGANELQASAVAIISTALNAGVEISGGIETLPANLKGGDTNAILQWVLSMPEEGIEEVVQKFNTGSTEKLIFDHDRAIYSTTDPDAVINPKEMGKEFAMGTAVGGILGGIQMGTIEASNALANRLAGNQYVAEEELPETLEQAAREAVMDEEMAQEPTQEPVVEPVSEVEQEPDTEPTYEETEPVAEETMPTTEEEAHDEAAQETTSLEGMTFEEAMAAFNGGGKYDVINHEAVKQAIEDGSISEVMEILDKIGDDKPRSRVESRAEEAAFEAGKANVPREKVSLETPAQEKAYNDGRVAAIAEMGKNDAKADDAQAEIETARAEMDALAQELGFTYKQNSMASQKGHVQYDFYDENGLPALGMNHNEAATESELEEIQRSIRKLKLVKSQQQEYTEGKKVKETKQTFNEPGISDLSAQLSIRDVATVDGIKYTLDIDKNGEYRLSIDRDTAVLGGRVSDARANLYKGGPFATRSEAVQEAIDVARASKLTKTIEEDVSNGEVAEVSDEGRVLESDESGKSDGRLLDGVASENVQEDARGGDSVSVSERDGRESDGRADGADPQRDGRGRSVGSDQGTDLQPSSGTVNHVPLSATEELDNALNVGSDYAANKAIYEFYKKDPSPAAAIEFMKKRYGFSGGSHALTDGTRALIHFDSKGITLQVGDEKHTFSWKRAEKRIRQLITEGKYYKGAETEQVKENTEEAAPAETEEAKTHEEEIAAEVEEKTELATQESARGNNFVIPEGGLNLPKGDKARFKANVEAIKTLNTLIAENRRATPAEQEILSKYVGWGGLANAFDESKADWAKEYKQLKNLLSEQEYKSARGSTLNAHYTDVGVIRAIYNGLAGIGFKGGRVLEPSAGIGHFAGAMPSEIASNSSWTMVELDSITGNIAKYLYPNADVRVQGFETAKIPDNYMDMAISNVPFGNYGIADKSYPKAVTSAIHNYFFAKALDKVRPGGVVCFITSRYTMDSSDSSVRHYIAQRADLLGAIRLPDSAFKSNANTEVVTDILILKKREPGTAYSGEAFETTGYNHREQNIWEMTNDYFAKHPEMVLGEASSTGSMYRGGSLTYAAKPGNLQKQIEKAFASIKGKMDYPVKRTQEQIRAEIREAAGKAKNGQIIKKNGKLYRNRDGVLEEASDVGKGNEEVLSAVVELRDTARQLLDAQMDATSEAEIAKLRKTLNSQYDAFVNKYGILNNQKNKRVINMDVDAPFVLALENYDKDTKKATKADIFAKNTITPNKTVTSVNTVEEGLIVSMNETGGVDAKRIAELLGESEKTVTRALLDNRLAFKNRDGQLETAEKYLSGNVKAKLRDAEALAEGDKDYEANVEELRKIIPADIAAEDISVQPGATWIPDSVYGDFVAETLGSSNSGWRKNATVTYNKLLGTFSVTVTDKWLKSRPENLSIWGTDDRSFINIFEATLNSKSVTVTRKMEDGSRVVDKQATAAAQEKQEKIRAEFQRWLWDDETRKETLAKLYNDVFNNYVTPKYDGSNLVVNGSNAAKPLRPHQKDAVHRIVNSGGNTLLAHKVGAGKTYEMAAAAMKLRQLGIVKKPMFVVPKPLVAQWGNEFLDFFPAAKILVLGDKDFSAANRKLFANRIATGDYDAVILSQEQFKAVPMSMENQEAFYQEQITALELAMEESARLNGKRDPSVKQMERAKKSFETKLKKLADMKKDEENIDFEQLGVDSLFVDEAHYYKNLFYTTNMSNVSGLGDKEGSQKAFDLYMKVRYLQSLNGGRGIVFATATPVMNSMSEMYIMQKYLQGDLLESRGLNSFDAWANQFGEVRTVLEMNPSGKGFRQKQSFSRFKNLAELQQMFRAFADVLTEIPGLKIPTMKEGKRLIVESDPSEFQLDYIERLAERADAIKNRKVDPKEDNMLKVTSDGRKLSYTQRMVDPSLPYEDGNKIMKCADNVLSIWKDTKKDKGTQLIFCDLSTPKGGSNVEATTEQTTEAEDISIYDDIRNALIGAGVPAKEIAFIHDANTNEKKAKLFKDVNDGTVRVLIGSTGKMGVGMNAQKRIVALHHLDAPWRPGDIEQREGRALRQGNMNEEVGMYVYVTKQTFDSRMWDNLQRKATFINQVMAGDLTARESEGDGDFALSAAEIKAISSGNPLIMEQFEVSAELAKLENLERAHAKEVADAKKRIEKAKTDIANDEMTIQRLKADIAVRQDTTGDKFKVVVGGKTFTERKAAGEALIAEAKKRLKIVRDVETTEEIGSFAGFKLFVTNGGDLVLRGKGQYRAVVNMDSPAGTATRLEEAAKRMDTMLAATETRLAENKASISKLEKTVAAPFDKAKDLLELRKRNAAILAELNPESEANIAEMGDEDDGDYMVDNMAESTGEQQISKAEALWTAERVGDQGKTPMRLSEIVEKIRHDFGINVTTGHIRGAGVKGRYNRHDHGIRTKIANDLPTVAHELGHHLDTIYGLTNKDKLTAELKQELIAGLDQGMKEAYPEKKWTREGLAEFIRKYLQNHETAKIDYPEFTKYFLNSLSASDAALVAQLADEVNAYYSMDADTATSSIRLREEGGPDARTWNEKIRDKASVLYQAWVDSNHGIKLYGEATGSDRAYILAKNAAYSDAMAGQILISDLTDANGQYVGPGLKTALQGIDLRNKQEYRLFGEYLTVKHGPERLAEGMRVFADDRKNSTAFMERRAEELEQQYPQFKEAAERLYEFQTQFLHTWGVDTGLISEATVEAWGERWNFYVPFNRAFGKESRRGGARRGFANQTSTIKKARGSGRDLVHPVDNIVNNIVTMVNAGVRNNVMRTITDQAEALGANAVFLEKVPTPLVRRSFDMTGTKERLTESMGEIGLSAKDLEEVEGVLAQVDDILYQYGKGKAHGDVITVMKHGQQEFWKINDPMLLQSVTTMSQKNMEGILDAYAVISRFMTSNITGNNVVWSLFSNFPRDIMTMFTYSKTKNPFKLFGSMGKAYLNKAGNLGRGLDPLYREYLAMGGGNVSVYSADQDLAKRARKKLSGKKFNPNPLDWISFASETIEMGPRYATYKLLRESGVDPQEAYAGAMDITVNFRRGGRIAREMNKVIPFFNVSIQGLDKFRRWISAEEVSGADRKKVVRSRVFSFVAASAAIAALTYALNNGDEEDEKHYEQLSNYQKNSYWNIPLGDGKYFAIPKPRELAVLSSFMETAMEYGIGENEHAFDEFYQYATDNMLPKIASDLAQGDIANTIGSLGIVGVGAYMMANRDFLGKPIVSSGLQNLEAKDQYTNRTSKIAYWVGQAFEVSPMMVDYFFQQTLGGFWKWQKALLPVGGENVDLTLGVQNSYVKDNQYTTDLVNWMYDKADKSTKTKNSHPDDINAAITAKMDSNMTQFYSRFYGIAKDTKETNATRAARQTVLDMIREYQKSTDSEYTTPAQRAVYGVARSMGSTELLPSVMQTTIKDGDEIDHNLSATQYVEYQTDYLRLYWEYAESNLSTNATTEEQIAVLKVAKDVAMETATDRALARIGAPSRKFASKYGDVSATQIIDFKAGIAVAEDADPENGVKKADVVDVLVGMDATSDETWDLYFSWNDQSKMAHKAHDNDIDAELYLTATLEMDAIKAERNQYTGKEIKGSRRKKIEAYLNSVCDSYRDYLFLLGVEYESVRDDADYIAFFGREEE